MYAQKSYLGTLDTVFSLKGFFLGLSVVFKVRYYDNVRPDHVSQICINKLLMGCHILRTVTELSHTQSQVVPG